MVFKLTQKEIEQIENMVNKFEEDSKGKGSIIGTDQDITVVNFNGHDWIVSCIIRKMETFGIVE